MAVIYKMLGTTGNLAGYQVRVQRKETGKVCKKFTTKEAAEEFLEDYRKRYPSNHKRSTVYSTRRTLTQAEKRARKALKPQTIIRHGCILRNAKESRCEPLTSCRYYLDCLDEADRLGWVGWTAEPIVDVVEVEIIQARIEWMGVM